MTQLDVYELAANHQRDLGDDATDDAQIRASNLRSHGDDHGAALWREIAAELTRLRTAAE